MRELDIDLANRKPQKLTTDHAERADLVVTMGCGDQCPYLPGKTYIDWELQDPKGHPLQAGPSHPRRHRTASQSSRGRTPRLRPERRVPIPRRALLLLDVCDTGARLLLSVGWQVSKAAAPARDRRENGCLSSGLAVSLLNGELHRL
jgi:hypothetical protein